MTQLPPQPADPGSQHHLSTNNPFGQEPTMRAGGPSSRPGNTPLGQRAFNPGHPRRRQVVQRIPVGYTFVARYVAAKLFSGSPPPRTHHRWTPTTPKSAPRVTSIPGRRGWPASMPAPPPGRRSTPTPGPRSRPIGAEQPGSPSRAPSPTSRQHARAAPTGRSSGPSQRPPGSSPANTSRTRRSPHCVIAPEVRDARGLISELPGASQLRSGHSWY